MSESNEEIRYILKFYYKKGKNATQAAKKICDVYGPSAVSVRVAQIWFKRFQSGNFDVKDAPRSGRPITDKMDAIFEKVEQDRHISSYDVAEELGVNHKTVLAHLKKAGYTKKLDIWVPHELTERNLMNRVLICDSLLRRNETESFLKKLITGDEKWITYDKNVRKRSWSKAGQASQTVAKPGLTRNKVMLCVWWDWKGIIHYELLPPGRTIDSELYCEQLIRLKQEVERKRPELINRRGVMFHHDNARPHTSIATQQKLREFGWEVLMHPPYSPDLAPSDFHLFRSLQNSLGSVRLTSREDCQIHLSRYFDEKSQNFYSNGIMSLPTRWQKVIEQNGTYIL
jgi:[histone H3]-lysine36 N-dimethyltransferase SETMAR